LTFATRSRLLARSAGAALYLGRRFGNWDLAGSSGLSGHERLGLVDLFVLGGNHFDRLRRGRRGVKFGAKEYDEAAFFIDLIAHETLVLRIVQ
jgi:hypothetical protein